MAASTIVVPLSHGSAVRVWSAGVWWCVVRRRGRQAAKSSRRHELQSMSRNEKMQVQRWTQSQDLSADAVYVSSYAFKERVHKTWCSREVLQRGRVCRQKTVLRLLLCSPRCRQQQQETA